MSISIRKTKEINVRPSAMDIFSGAGGLAIGFLKAGYNILLASDIDQNCESTFKYNLKNIPFVRCNISELTSNIIRKCIDKREIDILLGGPPCQGFSTIGNRASSDPTRRTRHDPRNELFAEYLRVLKLVNAKFFLMENVRGLLTYKKGLFFDNLIRKIKQAGYTNVDYKVLNAADYGVPQFRERIFIIGNRVGKKMTFPEPSHSGIHLRDNGKLPYSTVQEALSGLDENYYIPNHIPLRHGEINIARYKLIPEGGRMPERALPRELYRKNFGNTFKRLHRNKPSLTLVPGHNAFPVHPTLDRTLTPREAARLQVFPDDFIFFGNRQSQCTQVGNAVPPLLAQALAMHLKKNLIDG